MAAATHEGLSPKRVIGYVRGMTQPKIAVSRQLWNRVADLKVAADYLIYLAGAASDRLTLTQGAFFVIAAAADAAGKPATRSGLIMAYEKQFRGSIRNSYRQLLEPSRSYPKALGWLAIERNPNDDREQLLRLTKKGKSVVEHVLIALEPSLARA